MTEYEITTLSLIVKPKGEPIFSDQATIIEIADEAAGPFLVLRQIHDRSEEGEIRFDLDEWPKINQAIEAMLIVCENQLQNK
jgi:hypothetical protein